MKLKNRFKLMMWLCSIISFLLLSINYIMYRMTAIEVFYPLWITFLTIFYHFAMRLLVGAIVGAVHKIKQPDYHAKWFQQKSFEPELYKKLQVKKWKKHMPTYSPEDFSLEKHSWEEIVIATCGSELVHEWIVVFSFVPLLFAIPFGEFMVFLLTSIGAAVVDVMFVIMQRYNRPRLMRMIK